MAIYQILITSATVFAVALAYAEEPFQGARTAIANGDFMGALQQLQQFTTADIQDQEFEELLYLKAYALAHLPGVPQEQLTQAIQAVVRENPGGHYAEDGLFLLGIWEYRKGDFDACRRTLTELIQSYPSTLHRAEAIFYTARCLDLTGAEGQLAQKLYRDVYETAPSTAFADEAYFYAYPYEEYLIGNPEATTHLYQLGSRFPQSPYAMVAYYLKGMEIKRAELAKEAHQRQQWNQAIEAFQQAQTSFEGLVEKNTLPTELSDYLTALYFRAGIERAQANLAIAMTSSTAKRQICLEYTFTTYRDLLQRLKESQAPYLVKFRHSESYQPLLEECHFSLAVAYTKGRDDVSAEALLVDLLQFFQVNATSRGYYLARAHGELAYIFMRRGNYSTALASLRLAEEAAKGRVLSTDERLELLISESLCQREIGNSESAMLLLSQVINDDSISGLRLKAMLLRAEMYEQQGRPELAQKQLMALTRKGGDWGRQAKLKLERNYGHP